ncbi:MAG: hypothetical protein EOO09_07835 [Chitinophagaceae bacterium]|nr:MAG: hypothetical protein EOO09_07835 [Chitinophagaceae bacterium]
MSDKQPVGKGTGKYSQTKRIFRRVMKLLALLLVLMYLLVCLSPWLPPASFWFAAVLGYGFPFLLAAVLLALLVLIIRRSRLAFVPLVLLLLGFQQIRAAIAFHFGAADFRTEKKQGSLRVMLWNVSAWDQTPKAGKEFASFRNLMMDAVQQQQADVLCFQEFFEPSNSKYFDSNIEELRKMGYSYHHFYPKSVTYSGRRLVGLIILSKYPIVDSATVRFANTPHSEGLVSADIKVNDKTVRVFSTHLESSRTSGRGAGNVAGKAKNVLSRLKQAYYYRQPQAELVKQAVEASPYPAVLCANLGDIPNSWSYFKVKGNMDDAFLKKGAGFGRTYRFLSPTVRVDYIFAGNGLRVDQFNIPGVTYSDHYPLVCDLLLD